MTITRNRTTHDSLHPKVETLAALYLTATASKVTDETIATLCDWLTGEFQQLPLNLQFSDYMRYRDAAAMFADIEQDHLWVAADSYDSSLFPNPIYGFYLQATHDYDHYLTQSDFSLAGEIIAYNAISSRAPSLEIQKILYSEIVLRSAAHLYLGQAPDPKIVFP
jgi:hypothetical protein